MLNTSPLAAAAGKNETFEKEYTKKKNTKRKKKKRACEMWQLKLSSGGGTYGIHFCFVRGDDWSFTPKNIVVKVQSRVLLLHNLSRINTHDKFTREDAVITEMIGSKLRIFFKSRDARYRSLARVV